MAEADRIGRPREADRHDERGGENSIPRSFGLTLAVLRDELGVDQAGMMQLLVARTDSPYAIRGYVLKEKGRLQAIDDWETAKHDPPFSVQHRYGLVSDTWSGILHLVSLFYADLRDASDARERAEKLAQVKLVAGRVIEMAKKAQALAQNYENLGLDIKLAGKISSYEVRERHKEIVRDLLAAYRSCSTSGGSL